MKKLFRSLRFRLILLVLMAVIPAMGVALYTGLEQRVLARENAEESALRLARAVASYQSAQIEGARQLTSSIALLASDQLHDLERCGTLLRSINSRFPIYSSINIIRQDGTILCSSTDFDPSLNLSDRKYFQAAMKTDSIVAGEAILSRSDNRLSLPFAMRISRDNGVGGAVVTVLIDIEKFSNITQSIELPKDSAILLVDQKGTVLLRYPSQEQWIGRSFPNIPVIQEILGNRGEGRAEAVGLDGTNRFYGFTQVLDAQDYRLMASVGIPSAVAFADVDRALWTNVILIAVIAVIALLIAWFGGDYLFLRVVSLTAERDEAERRLRVANEELESRVIERTSELDLANKQLSVELLERQRVLEQLRRREEELEKMLILVERSNRELENFAYITSHDLQEPLRKIQAFGERLARKYTENLGEEGVNYVTRMSSAANRMQKMVNDLLTYSRVSTRGGDFVLLDLNDVLRDVLSDLEMRLNETGGKIQADNLPIIQADASQMRQLMQNLLVNALKFHKPGVPPLVRVRCEDGSKAQTGGNQETGNQMVTIIIEDNGIGFDEKYLDRIFLPFQRLHGHDVYEGSGIGLAVCRKIIERHHGTITAKSRPGEGSRFIIEIPRSFALLEGE